MKSPTLLLKTLFVTACLACGLNASAYDFEYDGIYYNIVGENAIEVTYKDTNYNSYSGDITLQTWARDNEGKEYYVVAIGESAFKNCTGLTHLYIPPSVKRCTGEPFNGCTHLQYIYTNDLKAWCEIDFGGLASNNPLNIAHNLYVYGHPIGDAVIPEGTTVIKSMAFISCTNLTSITIPNSVTRIEWGALSACHNLETVRLGSGITEIDDHAFNYSENIRTIFCDATTPPVIGGDETFSSEVYSNATLIVPESSLNAYHTADYWKDFSSIRAKAFDFYADGFYFINEGNGTVGVTWHSTAGNTYSGNVIVPETVTYRGRTYTVTKVEANAFTRCPNLTSVILPPTITTVNYAFYYNDAEGMIEITSLPINPPYGMTQMTADQYANVIVNVPKNSLAAYQADAGWGQFAHIIGMDYDFERDGLYYNVTGDNTVEVTYGSTSYNSYSGSVSIPEQVTYGGVTYDVTAVGASAFRHCSGLTDITFPSSIKSIGNYAFYQCTGLTGSLPLMEGLETIGNYAFAYCSGLTGVRFPNSVNSIGSAPFGFCTGLTKFTRTTQDSNAPYIITNGVVFTNFPTTKTLAIYPGGITAAYTVPDGTVYIGPHAFRGAKVKAVTLPNTVKELKEYAFANCTDITTMEVNKGVTSIGSNAFSNCTSLTSVILPSTLTSLGVRAFYNDDALTVVACKAKTPPVCEISGSGTSTSTPFDISHFTSTMLRVPTGYKSAYQAANIWKLFSTIREDDSLLEPDFTMGDVNSDGVVNVTDVTTLISCVVNDNTSNINVEAADMNGDGNINVTDVTILINTVVNN